MPTLIEISDELLALQELIEGSANADGEITPEVEEMMDKWFAAIMSDRDNKMDNYGALIRECELRAAARKEEMERLSIRVRVDTNKVKFLKERLRQFLDTHHMPKVETRRYKFSCCGNGGLQPLDMPDDAEKLPKDYQKQVVIPNTEKVRADLAAGKEVEGCKLLPRGRHLRIT